MDVKGNDKTRYVLIRNLTEEDNKMLQEIKRDTGCQQASKALLQTGYAYLRLMIVNRSQREKIIVLETENRKLRQSADAILKAVGNIESVIKNDIQ